LGRARGKCILGPAFGRVFWRRRPPPKMYREPLVGGGGELSFWHCNVWKSFRSALLPTAYHTRWSFVSLQNSSPCISLSPSLRPSLPPSRSSSSPAGFQSHSRSSLAHAHINLAMWQPKKMWLQSSCSPQRAQFQRDPSAHQLVA
jgi:hypothetical protein